MATVKKLMSTDKILNIKFSAYISKMGSRLAGRIQALHIVI